MQIKTYPCHGWMIDKTTLRRGEFINDRVMASNHFTVSGNKLVRDDSELKRYWWFMESGHNKHTNIDTGVESNQTWSWSNKSDPMADGDYALDVLDPCVVWCFNETANETLPNFDYHSMLGGETFSFQAGNKVFLMGGSINFGGTVVTGPRQIVISANKIGTADTPSMFIVLRD